MSLKIPLAVNYQSPIVFLPGVWDNNKPNEGTGYCPFEINWGPAPLMGGPNNCVSINLSNNVQSPNSMSQIVSISVDNSQCGVDVIFVFPDTSETVTIPANNPKIIVPVFTRAIAFFVIAEGATPGDTTRFLLHNVVPPPIAVPTSTEQALASNSLVTAVLGTTQVVPLGTDGVLEALTVFVSDSLITVEHSTQFVFHDGSSSPKMLASGVVGGNKSPSPDGYNVMIINLQNLAVRFTNGITLTLANSVDPAEVYAYNIYYRQTL